MAWIRGKDEANLVQADAPRRGPYLPQSKRGGDAVATTEQTPSRTQAEEQAADSGAPDWYITLKQELHQQVISALDLSAIGKLSEDQLREEVRRHAAELCRDRPDLLTFSEREQLVNEVLDEAFGLGPLEVLMRDPTITDILINGPKTVYVERRGRLERTPVMFHDDQHVLHVVRRIVSQIGRRVDETCPMVDARLPDGSRLNAIIPPVALDGPLVSIRRFGARPLTPDDLLDNDSITEEMLDFLAACVEARINIVISGGTGSGKTTLLNCLSRFIPSDERVATIEDSAELQLQQPHVVRMETRAANVEGEGEITSFDLVRNALRMRPDRIVVGECRGPEALDMMQAMNTGHEGSMTTIHANSPRDAMDRLEMMVGMAGYDIPLWVVRRQVASAIHVVVQVSRLMGGLRKVINISEITGMEGDVLSMQPIFEFKQTGLDEQRVAEGYYSATGIRPSLLDRLDASGAALPVELFERRILSSATNGKPR